MVYGARGLNIALLERLGFEVLAVVDEREAGRTMNGRRVLSPEFARALEPDALLRTPRRMAAGLRERFFAGGGR